MFSIKALVTIGRRMRRSPGFAATTVLTLALGIGLNVTIFSLVYRVVLEPLDYPEPERLVEMTHAAPGLGFDDIQISIPLYLLYLDQTTSFQTMGLFSGGRIALTGLDRPERIRQARMTASMFEVLGGQPLLGRRVIEDDQEPGAEPIAVLSHRLWERLFGASRAVIDGETIELDGTPHRIVGVMQPGFDLPERDVEVWRAMTIDPSQPQLGNFVAQAYARLGPGVDLDAALADGQRLIADLEAAFPDRPEAGILARSDLSLRLLPLHDRVVGEARQALWLLLGGVAFVLLLACANVANLFLVRGESRHREIAVRSAIGASRSQLVGGFLVEALILGLVSSAASLALAQLAHGALVRWGLDLPRLDSISLGWPVIVFALGLGLLTALLFGALPAYRFTRPDLVPALKEQSRHGSSRSSQRTRNLLVVTQIALGIVLLIGAGLALRSFWKLLNTSPGFSESGALTLHLSLPTATYDSPETVAAFVERATERLGALPGVEAVGTTTTLPLSGMDTGSGHGIESHPLEDGEPPPVLMLSYADSGYIDALDIPLLQGRWLEDGDHRSDHAVAVVSESTARQFWPDGNALGQRIARGSPDNGWIEIVGVVGDVHSDSLRTDPRNHVYYPMISPAGGIGGTIALVLETDGLPEALIEPTRQVVWSLDANVPISREMPVSELVADSRESLAFAASLLALSAVMALLLGGLGVYGVISYLVAQRTQEIGLRMALGARAGQVGRGVIWGGALLGLAGTIVGLALAAALTRFLESMLFGIDPHDPITFAIVPLVLLTTTVLASLIPAIRAARLDPLLAIRYE